MTDEETDAVLAELAAVAAEMIADTAVAERDLDMWTDAEEQYIESGPPIRSRPDPRRAVVSMRSIMAIDTAGNLRQATREIVAWWADLATYAALATAGGRSIDPVRAAGADPSAVLTSEDLASLPAPSEYSYQLASLAARMADTPVGPYEQRDDLLALTRDLTARNGLKLRRSDVGELIVADDFSAEARRRRLWGDIWIDHRLPELPAADQLVDALAAGGVPPAVIADVRGAAAAVDDVVAASRHLSELESIDVPHPSTMQKIDDIWPYVAQATDILAGYAEALTRHLPAIRATAPAQPRS